MKNALITGANRGIGLELARQLHDGGWAVTALVRHSSEALDALGVHVEAEFDVTNEHALASLAERWSSKSIDLLINNAGILRPMSLNELDLDGMRRQYEVNAIGPLRVTQALLPALGDALADGPLADALAVDGPLAALARRVVYAARMPTPAQRLASLGKLARARAPGGE